MSFKYDQTKEDLNAQDLDLLSFETSCSSPKLFPSPELESQRTAICLSPEELSKKRDEVRSYYETQAELVAFQRSIDAAIIAETKKKTIATTTITPKTPITQNATLTPNDQEDSTPTLEDNETTPSTTATTPESIEESSTAATVEEDNVVSVTVSEETTTPKSDAPRVAFAINASASVNVALLIVKLYAAATSGSVAVAASCVDSLMDLISGLILWISSQLSSKRDSLGFPVGKSRFETIAIVLFSSIMGFASLSLIREGAQSLSAGPVVHGADVSTLSIIAAVVASKGLLFWLCTSLRHVSATCEALALDHLNDVMTNSATLVAIGVASRFRDEAWWFDPAACIILSVIMLRIWFKTGMEHVRLLISVAASSLQLSKLTYVAYSHPALFVDTVMAYYVGARLQVEVDIVLPAKLPLNKAHDIGEALTLRLEALDDVERAFVHLDTEWDHMRAIEHVDPYSKDL